MNGKIRIDPTPHNDICKYLQDKFDSPTRAFISPNLATVATEAPNNFAHAAFPPDKRGHRHETSALPSPPTRPCVP